MLFGVMGTSTACAPRFPDPFWTGAHLAYATTTDVEVCAGSWVVQDRYVELLSELLGVEPPRPIHFAFIERSERDEFCEDGDLLGCTIGDEAYSIYAVQLHELAHAVAMPAGIRGPLAFQEGFAEVFSDGQDSEPDRLPIADVVRDFAADGGSYYTAGLFVRFLIEEYGLEKLLAFMRGTTKHGGFEGFSKVFKDVYGVALSDTFVDFEDYPSCTMWNNRIALFECASPEVPWDGGNWRATSPLACDSPDVLGPVPDGDNMLIWTTRTVEIQSDGEYQATVKGDVAGSAGARITRCASCWDSVDAQVHVGQSRTLTLTAGRYGGDQNPVRRTADLRREPRLASDRDGRCLRSRGPPWG